MIVKLWSTPSVSLRLANQDISIDPLLLRYSGILISGRNGRSDTKESIFKLI